MAWFFVFFFVSGFCSILYELVWLRLSMAQFGVTTALVSIVLSMFMAGLGLGSWISGRLLRRYELTRSSALRIYGSIEFLIAVSALLAPKPPKAPGVTPMPDPLAQDEARRRSIAEQMSRRGRASTIMTQPGGKLGG